MDRRELRLLEERYFYLGFKNQVILDFLKDRHGILMSLSTLKRRLCDYGLRRRGALIEGQELREILLREISGPGQLRGYRAVWRPALPHLMRLLFIFVLLFYLRFTFLFVICLFICVFNFAFHCFIFQTCFFFF